MSLGALGAAHGGYFGTSWGWAIVAGAAAVAWAASLGDAARPTGIEIAFLSGLTALAVWCALSSLWGSRAQTIDETARALVYVILCGLAVTAVRRVTAAVLLGGVLTASAALSLYALATRLFPDRIGTFDSVATYRLATPIGYWNALGLLCVIGLLVALALVAASESAPRAALAAAPAPVLAAALYFTFSRGSWLALAAGFVFGLALTPHRVRMTIAALALGAPAAVTVLLALHEVALTHQQATVAQAAHDGHRYALVVLALVVVAAALGAGATIVLARRVFTARGEGAYAALLVLALIAAVVAVLVHYGGPASAVRRGWDSFSAPAPKTQVDLRKRLFSFSSNHRVDLWRAALHDFEAHKLVGSGGGSYEQYWLSHRTTALKVRDAHSLYLETLAELGIVGLIALLAALVCPLVAAVRARRHPLAGAATAAYVAFLVHAGVDWDWEITSVTLAGLLVGVALLALARRDDDERKLARGPRTALLVATLAIAAFGFVFLVGNMFLSRASAAAGSGHWATAAKDAKRASTWLPWSTDPQRQLGEAQLAQGNTKAAQASFHSAIDKDRTDWNLWLDLARASNGKAQAGALAQATRLNPLSPEITELKTELGSSGGIAIGAKP
jgi:O-antigen ligase